MAPSSPYAELHAHSCWSLREGASATDEMVGRALVPGYPATAITDHDNLYGRWSSPGQGPAGSEPDFPQAHVEWR